MHNKHSREVEDARYSVLGTRYSVLGSRYSRQPVAGKKREPLCTYDKARTQKIVVLFLPGTGPEVYANTNAPPAVAYSAIIYALRCLVPRDIPLNQVS